MWTSYSLKLTDITDNLSISYTAHVIWSVLGKKTIVLQRKSSYVINLLSQIE